MLWHPYLLDNLRIASPCFQFSPQVLFMQSDKFKAYCPRLAISYFKRLNPLIQSFHGILFFLSMLITKLGSQSSHFDLTINVASGFCCATMCPCSDDTLVCLRPYAKLISVYTALPRYDCRFGVSPFRIDHSAFRHWYLMFSGLSAQTNENWGSFSQLATLWKPPRSTSTVIQTLFEILKSLVEIPNPTLQDPTLFLWAINQRKCWLSILSRRTSIRNPTQNTKP